MFGLTELKKDLIVVGIIILAIFGLYKYHQSMKDAIADRDKTIISLNVTIKDRDTTITTLEGANKTLVKDVELEQGMCKARMTELGKYYENEKAQELKNKDKRDKNKGKIDIINKDPNKTVDQKLQETLVVEYDIMSGN